MNSVMPWVRSNPSSYLPTSHRPLVESSTRFSLPRAGSHSGTSPTERASQHGPSETIATGSRRSLSSGLTRPDIVWRSRFRRLLNAGIRLFQLSSRRTRRSSTPPTPFSRHSSRQRDMVVPTTYSVACCSGNRIRRDYSITTESARGCDSQLRSQQQDLPGITERCRWAHRLNSKRCLRHLRRI
ncbi:hypothetical protein Htur_4030 (plasmid) [Haloterrigena turkmenica DSM 5511]|uniref:Uncharacterized protein n=1 Tax=Haloterrigena turkmenica (strain ATCC 51198 / DSM 5511 / JCM 9101 / NCIMB 13204 / VKM B-1734 / 4k) TaxID=543526 RepID=D2S0H6_HALTV|nr:hypothetical protein Htur_4030 [Haloterrigena turkmenica DSM 5511]